MIFALPLVRNLLRGRLGLSALTFIAINLGLARADDRAPEWLAAVIKAPLTVPHQDAAAVVLWNETLLEVAPSGTFTTRTRIAIKVLTGEGQKATIARVPYNTDAMRVKGLQAWLIPAQGKIKALGKRHMADTAVHLNAMELYGEARQQVISAAADARPGAVFAFESIVEETSVLSQRIWSFQSPLPVERMQFTVKLPPDWRLKAHSFNEAPSYATDDNQRYTWARTALPAVVLEPMAPPAPTFSPWVAVDLIPPLNRPKSNPRVVFDSWAELAAYFGPKYDSAAVADAAMKARADERVRAATTPFERLRVLAADVQQVNYIFIQLDAANVGGFIPRQAPRVFRSNYGDCKDKATLLRAMLATQGIVSYPLIVQAGATPRLREGWPSALQFNHAILAIQVDDTVNTPAVIQHPSLGRLLIFDPTNEFTPLGDLADGLLADQGLLLAGEHQGLITLPVTPPEANHLERRVRATLDGQGGITGTIEEKFFGQASASARAERRRHGEADFSRRIERWLATTLPAAQTTRVETDDAFEANRFSMTANFASVNYGKLMRDELLVFKPILVSRRGAAPLRKVKRTQPVLLRPSRYTERTEIALPRGCTVEETIPPVSLVTPFGSYHATVTFDAATLIFERALDLRAAEIPARDYEAVRSFFEKILQTEQSPVVLRRARAEG